MKTIVEWGNNLNPVTWDEVVQTLAKLNPDSGNPYKQWRLPTVDEIRNAQHISPLNFCYGDYWVGPSTRCFICFSEYTFGAETVGTTSDKKYVRFVRFSSVES